MNKIIMMLFLTTGLFSSDCKIHMVSANSGAENAVDYALRGNHKYALIEINLAIEYTGYALESCKGEFSSDKMDELSQNLSSLKDTRKQIEKKLK